MPSSILVFTNELIPSDKVGLGTLTYDIDTPWDDPCEDLDLHEAEVQIADEPRLYDFIESGLANGASLDVPFIKSPLHHPLTLTGELKLTTCVFPVVSKSYSLKSPEKHLDRICNDVSSHEWLDEAIDSGQPIYLLTGMHTVLPGQKGGGTSDSVNTVLGAAFLGMPFLPVGTSYSMGGPMLFSGKVKRKNGLPGEEDKVLGLEYRQVKLRRVIVELEDGGTFGRSEKGGRLYKGELLGWVGRDVLVESFYSVVDDGKGSFIVSL